MCATSERRHDDVSEAGWPQLDWEVQVGPPGAHCTVVVSGEAYTLVYEALLAAMIRKDPTPEAARAALLAHFKPPSENTEELPCRYRDCAGTVFRVSDLAFNHIHPVNPAAAETPFAFFQNPIKSERTAADVALQKLRASAAAALADVRAGLARGEAVTSLLEPIMVR